MSSVHHILSQPRGKKVRPALGMAFRGTVRPNGRPRCRDQAILAVVLASLVSTVCVADSQAQEPAGQLDAAELEKRWKEFATPGKPHERFKLREGEYDAKSVDFMINPGSPEASDASATFKVLMDGRYLLQEYHGTSHGQPFQGMRILGYDNARNKYTSVWIDNMGTGIMRGEGSYDATTKTMTELVEGSSPVGPMKLRMTTKDISDDKFVLTMYWIQKGGEMKTMEVTYTRK